MAYLGKQINIVYLLGLVTQSHKLMVIVEYCELGNLKEFLVKHRGSFKSQVNEKTGNFTLDLEPALDEQLDRYVKVPAKKEASLFVFTDEKLNSMNLINFTYQISRGMQYIHSKIVI